MQSTTSISFTCRFRDELVTIRFSLLIILNVVTMPRGSRVRIQCRNVQDPEHNQDY